MSNVYPTLMESTKALPLYLTSIGLYYNEVSVQRNSGYIDYQWIQTVSGSGRIFLNNEEIILTPSTGLFIPANVPHSYIRHSDHWLTHWISFNGSLFPNLIETLNLKQITPISGFDITFTHSLFESIYKKVIENYNKNAFPISADVYAFIEHIYTSFTTNKTPLLSKNSQLNQVLNYIEQYYMMELSLQELSHFIHVSPQYLCRMFKTQLMMRPFEYINQVRINKSKTLLSQLPELTIEQIAEKVGYHNPSYFAAQFKALEKITPREFIQIHQRGVE